LREFASLLLAVDTANHGVVGAMGKFFADARRTVAGFQTGKKDAVLLLGP
jgi:hypothetical protein